MRLNATGFRTSGGEDGRGPVFPPANRSLMKVMPQEQNFPSTNGFYRRDENRGPSKLDLRMAGSMREERTEGHGGRECRDGGDPEICSAPAYDLPVARSESSNTGCGRERQSARGLRCRWGKRGSATGRSERESASRPGSPGARLRTTSRNGERRDDGSRRARMRRLHRWQPQGVPERRGKRTGWRERAASGNYAT